MENGNRMQPSNVAIERVQQQIGALILENLMLRQQIEELKAQLEEKQKGRPEAASERIINP